MIFLWNGLKPICVNSINGGNIDITTLRGLFDFEKIMSEAIDEYNEFNFSKNWKTHNRFFVSQKYGSIGTNKENSGRERGEVATNPSEAPKLSTNRGDKRLWIPTKWTEDDIGQPKKESAFEDLYYPDNVKEAIKEAYLWRDNEEWFKSKGIRYSRGFLLVSKPGSGKSAFVRALAQELNMPIISFDLATMTNRNFSDEWASALGYSPCIVLFEDIDAVFDGRKNVATTGNEQGLSFDCFLNVIDGVSNSDGIFKIITTNDLSKVDPAIGCPTNGDEMSSRPGRIDRVIHFANIDKLGKEKMAQRILGDFPKEKWEHLFSKSENDTGAQFQERCCRLALQLFWKDSHSLDD